MPVKKNFPTGKNSKQRRWALEIYSLTRTVEETR